MLLNHFGGLGAGNLQSIAVVDTDTVVGDVTVTAGSVLFSGSGGGKDKDVLVFAPTVAGTADTAGIVSVLINGPDVGISQNVSGLDLVETPTTLAGKSLAAGTLLLGSTTTTPWGATRPRSAGRHCRAHRVEDDPRERDRRRDGGAAVPGVGRGAVLRAGAAARLRPRPHQLLPAHQARRVPGDPGPLVQRVVGAGERLRPGRRPLTATLAAGPADGVVTLYTDGTFTYTPAAGYTGPDSFTYTARDGNGGTATGTVSVSVLSRVLVVDTTSDVADGDTSSILALLSNKGLDGGSPCGRRSSRPTTRPTPAARTGSSSTSPGAARSAPSP